MNREQHNKDFYQNSIKEFGVSPEGVHWNSVYTQYKRFEIITKLIRKVISNSTLVDVGCGFGEYYNYLIQNNRVPKKYIGYDCEVDMVNISKKRFIKQEFYLVDVLKDKLSIEDYYISSGAMNLLKKEDIDIFIKNCFNASKKGFIFNYLKYITFEDISQEDIIDICKKYTNDIVIKENYLYNDFTVFMKKVI